MTNCPFDATADEIEEAVRELAEARADLFASGRPMKMLAEEVHAIVSYVRNRLFVEANLDIASSATTMFNDMCNRRENRSSLFIGMAEDCGEESAFDPVAESRRA